MATRKVYVSPSSQTGNIGVGTYGSEASRMQQLSDKLVPKLRAAGHTVYGGNNTLTLAQRIAASNSYGVDLHIALHSNAANGTARGTETWYYTTSTNGKRIAGLVQAEIMKIDPSRPNRGIKASTTYQELNSTTAVAVIIEVGFHDNAQDATWIVNNLDKIATAIATAIAAY